MNEIGTRHIIRVIIECEAMMRDLDFALDFYVERGRAQHLEKGDLIAVETEGDTEYYALIDSSFFGRGHLMCRATVRVQWQGEECPVVIREYTGMSFGQYRGTATRVNEGEFAMRFEWMKGSPYKPGNIYMFYGKLTNVVRNYSEITEEMLWRPENRIASVPAGVLRNYAQEVKAGDKIVVLLPTEPCMVATKDDGFGNKVPFDTSIAGANGEVQLMVKGQLNRLYGEFLTIGGTMFINVDYGNTDC